MFASSSTEQVESELVTLAGHLAAGTCRFLQLLAEFDTRRGWAGPGLRSCVQWLGWRTGLSARTARDQLRVARALRTLPATTAAFAAGRISYSKARAITRIATAESEEALLAIALHGTTGQLEDVVRAARSVVDPRPPDLRRALRTSRAADGSLLVRLRIPADRGHLLMAALDAALADSTPAPPATPPASGHAVGTLEPGAVETPRRGGSAQPLPHLADTPPEVRADALQQGLDHAPGPALDPLAARRLDALLDLVTGASTARPPTLVVHVRAEALDVGAAHGIGDVTRSPAPPPPDVPAAWIEGGPPVPPSVAARLTCTAGARALVVGPGGTPLHLGRRRRGASPAQLLALRVRDRGRCVVPGCGATRHLDAHHLRPWALGGPTDLDNLALVCGAHHRLVHEHGYRLTRDPGGAFLFARPEGEPVPPSGPPLDGRSDRLVADHVRARIGDRTLTPEWNGERLDLRYAVAVLLPALSRAAPAAA